MISVLTQTNSTKTVQPSKNYTEIATDEELSSLVQEFFEIDQTNFLSYVQINLQGYHNTSNITEDRAPKK